MASQVQIMVMRGLVQVTKATAMSFENNHYNNDLNNKSTVKDSSIQASVVINSSSNFAQSEDISNETQGQKIPLTSTAKKGRFIQILLHSL